MQSGVTRSRAPPRAARRAARTRRARATRGSSTTMCTRTAAAASKLWRRWRATGSESPLGRSVAARATSIAATRASCLRCARCRAARVLQGLMRAASAHALSAPLEHASAMLNPIYEGFLNLCMHIRVMTLSVTAMPTLICADAPLCSGSSACSCSRTRGTTRHSLSLDPRA